MMRASTFLRAALVSPQKPCASAATGLQLVNRILGRSNHGATCAQSFGKILEKNPSGNSAIYAHLGRAMVFLNRGEDKLALLDVESAAQAAAGAKTAAKLIASLRFQCSVRLLAEEQRKQTISGATTELDVANKVAAVRAALEALSSAVGQDYAVSLAAGEFFLYYASDAAAAAGHFATAVKLAEAAGKPSIQSAGTAAPEAVAAAAIDASTTEMPSDLKSKNIGAETLTADAAAIEGLKATFGALSDSDLTLLGSVMACEARGGAVFDSVHSVSEDFGAWRSEKAAMLSRRVAQVCHPLVPSHPLKVAKPSRAFFMEGVSVADVVKKCPADKHILDAIPEVPRSQLTAEDADFFAAFDALNRASSDSVPAGNSAAAQYYASLAKDLMQQVVFRAKVGQAEALTALGETAQAAELVQEVEAADAYVDMWRLFAAKGALMRKIGRVEDADAAFKQLHALKHQKAGMDLPLMDENRHKSAF
uniref:Uncharacterized protein n=1 Tax=Neobodo designis TaxID=312471 RepID=A0A7S1L636_NEODS